MFRKPILKVAERISHPHPDSFLTFMIVLTKRTFTLTIRRKFAYWAIGTALAISATAFVGSGYGFWATKKIMSFSNLERETKEQQEQLRESLARADELEATLGNLTDLFNEIKKEASPRGAASQSAADAPGAKKAEAASEQSDKISVLKSELSKTDTRLKSLQAQMGPIIYAWTHTPSVRPTVGNITSRFGMRIHPFSRGSGGDDPFLSPHTGVDFANEVGTPIQATANGEVTFTGWLGNLGQTVIIRHTPELETVYGHLHRVHVRVGQKVERGHQIGTMGATGRATGPHLHYEIRKKGQAVNPEPYLRLQRQWLTAQK
jgi:murein DD-endopeptidase MepM/ murein hydrolase activator NlpD